MATAKMTFSLDEETTARLERTAERLHKPKSQVVREAIYDFSERVGRLSEKERLEMLRTFDEVMPRIPGRPLGEVKRELEAIRRARKGGGRRSTASTDR